MGESGEERRGGGGRGTRNIEREGAASKMSDEA